MKMFSDCLGSWMERTIHNIAGNTYNYILECVWNNLLDSQGAIRVSHSPLIHVIVSTMGTAPSTQ